MCVCVRACVRACVHAKWLSVITHNVKTINTVISCMCVYICVCVERGARVRACVRACVVRPCEMAVCYHTQCEDN